MLLTVQVCDEIRQMCCDLKPFLVTIKILITIVQFSVPLLLIVLGTIDMFKVVATGDEKVATETKKTFISRLVYATIIFIVPFLVELIFDLVSDLQLQDDLNLTKPTSWVNCWASMSNSGDNGYCSSCNDIYLPEE